ncbi:MAG: YceI family protein [Flavobacteriales bacterium]|nr:YceI family protein [Flavobacteriales bacterium]
MKKVILIAFMSAMVLACNKNSSNNVSEDTNTTDSVQISTYEYQPDSTKLTWTAYKTTVKLPVNGTFKEIVVTPGKPSGTVKELMNQLVFDIVSSSISSNNEERDGKLVKTFFGSMTNSEKISGKITSVNGTDTSGKARISIKMNDIEHEVDAEYAISGNILEVKTMLHLGDWKAEPSIKALNNVCHDLHKGEDGVSKLWPEIQVVISTELKNL